MAFSRQQALPAGTDIDGFEIRRVIGTGGFGITYLGFDTSLERPVAIKEYCPHDIASRTGDTTTLMPAHPEVHEAYDYGLGRFLDEARTLARFNHPSIVHVHRYLAANGTAYLIMDFERGETLHRVLDGNTPLGEEQLLTMLLPLLEGLEMVHEERFLHRDIKPANIVVRERGVPVLLDFGAARLAMEEQEGNLTVMLTPGYAPLEQYSATDHQGPWSDIYALGATMFHCMTGKPPPMATERIASLHTGGSDAVTHRLRPVAGHYSNLLLETVQWMLEPVASQRPQSASELLRTLRRSQATDGLSGGGAVTRNAADFEATPEMTRVLEQHLTEHAGQLARRVVAPAVARATRYVELVDHLAGYVLDPEKEAAFRTVAATLREQMPPANTGVPRSGAPSRAPGAPRRSAAGAHTGRGAAKGQGPSTGVDTDMVTVFAPGAAGATLPAPGTGTGTGTAPPPPGTGTGAAPPPPGTGTGATPPPPGTDTGAAPPPPGTDTGAAPPPPGTGTGATPPPPGTDTGAAPPPPASDPVAAPPVAAGTDAPPAPHPPTTQSLREDVLRHVEQHLAELIGPIASLLVEQAAAETTSRDQLIALLAQELDDEAERREFLARVR